MSVVVTKQCILRSGLLVNVAELRRITAICGGTQSDFSALQTAWRRERDSNPRYPSGYIGFQDEPFPPPPLVFRHLQSDPHIQFGTRGSHSAVIVLRFVLHCLHSKSDLHCIFRAQATPLHVVSRFGFSRRNRQSLRGGGWQILLCNSDQFFHPPRYLMRMDKVNDQEREPRK
jgi:hypothetical protein